MTQESPLFAWNSHPNVSFLIIRCGKAPVEPRFGVTTRAGWTGNPEEWFSKDDEIIPGISVKFLGYGDQLDKDRNAVHGALIAVWQKK